LLGPNATTIPSISVARHACSIIWASSHSGPRAPDIVELETTHHPLETPPDSHSR
jgi:hypothetical protein